MCFLLTSLLRLEMAGAHRNILEEKQNIKIQHTRFHPQSLHKDGNGVLAPRMLRGWIL
jgi:hypothetical protein